MNKWQYKNSPFILMLLVKYSKGNMCYYDVYIYQIYPIFAFLCILLHRHLDVDGLYVYFLVETNKGVFLEV